VVAPHSPAETIAEPLPHLADAFVLCFSQRIVDGPIPEGVAARSDHGQRQANGPCPIDAPVSQSLTINLRRRLETGDPAADLCRVHLLSIARDSRRRPVMTTGGSVSV